MCGLIGTFLGVAGSVMQGIAANNAAKEQARIVQQQAEYQAQALEQNAAQARNDAEAVSKQGQIEDRRLREQVRRVRGSQAAAVGASGLSLASGSAMDVAADTTQQSEQDLDLLRKDYAQKKFRYVNEGVQYQGQANQARVAGGNQASALRSQGKGALYGSLLTGASLVAPKWGSIFGGGGSAGAATGGVEAGASWGSPVRSNPNLPDGWGWKKRSPLTGLQL